MASSLSTDVAGSATTSTVVMDEGGSTDEVSIDSSDESQLGHRIEQVVCTMTEQPLVVGRASEFIPEQAPEMSSAEVRVEVAAAASRLLQ